MAASGLVTSARFHTMRTIASAMPRMMVFAAPTGVKHRLVYDAGGSDQLPGVLRRSEGGGAVNDKAVDEAYDGAGLTYDFYSTLFNRNSLDDNGMALVSSVHVGELQRGVLKPMSNAYWNGEQMAYGDGDGRVFAPFTRSLDVIAHELSHGVVSFTSNLIYRGQSGALNEHFADVFGILVRKWTNANAKREDRDWLIGRELWATPGPDRRGIRDMENPGTAYDIERVGKDLQPGHMDNYYHGPDDNFGVHRNSGIANRAFVIAAKAIGGDPWNIPGRIWYDTMIQLTAGSQFVDAKRVSAQVANDKFGATIATVVKDAWETVGVADMPAA